MSLDPGSKAVKDERMLVIVFKLKTKSKSLIFHVYHWDSSANSENETSEFFVWKTVWFRETNYILLHLS